MGSTKEGERERGGGGRRVHEGEEEESERVSVPRLGYKSHREAYQSGIFVRSTGEALPLPLGIKEARRRSEKRNKTNGEEENDREFRPGFADRSAH